MEHGSFERELHPFDLEGESLEIFSAHRRGILRPTVRLVVLFAGFAAVLAGARVVGLVDREAAASVFKDAVVPGAHGSRRYCQKSYNFATRFRFVISFVRVRQAVLVCTSERPMDRVASKARPLHTDAILRG